MINKVVGVFLAIFPFFAYAGCGTVSCSSVQVEKLYIQAENNVLVFTSGDEKALNCTAGSNGTYLTLNVSDSNSKFIYSTLLAAQMAVKPVSIRIVENSSNCEISYMTIAQ